MNHLNLRNQLSIMLIFKKGTPTEIQNLSSNRLNFIKETTKRGDDVILKNMKFMITEQTNGHVESCNRD